MICSSFTSPSSSTSSAASRGIAFISAMEAEPWGGSEELWSLVAFELRKQGIPVSANVKHWPKEFPRLAELEKAGCSITRRRLRLPERILRKFSIDLSGRWLDTIRDQFVVISQGMNFDGVHWGIQCLQRGLDYAVIAHAAVEWLWPDEWHGTMMGKVYANARVCYFVSQANLELTRKQYALPLPNARVVRNPYNVSYEASPPWPDDDGILHLACVGRLAAASKGQDLILDVLRQDKWRQRPIHVTFFGRGPNEAGLKALARMYGLTNVTFGGFTNDVQSIWAKHHALILPSRIEGLPLAIVEAMLCGRPCIVTDIAGNAEAVEDDVTGFVAPAPTIGLLDQTLERAWSRRHEFQEMGRRSAQRIRTMVPADPISVYAADLIAEAGARSVSAPVSKSIAAAL